MQTTEHLFQATCMYILAMLTREYHCKKPTAANEFQLISSVLFMTRNKKVTHDWQVGRFFTSHWHDLVNEGKCIHLLLLHITPLHELAVVPLPCILPRHCYGVSSPLSPTQTIHLWALWAPVPHTWNPVRLECCHIHKKCEESRQALVAAFMEKTGRFQKARDIRIYITRKDYWCCITASKNLETEQESSKIKTPGTGPWR